MTELPWPLFLLCAALVFGSCAAIASESRERRALLAASAVCAAAYLVGCLAFAGGALDVSTNPLGWR